MKIPVIDIIPDPNQPRKTFNEEPLNELKASFTGLGLIQPITVRPHDGKYMIVVGERRYRAAIAAGDSEIECIVRENLDDKVATQMQLAENTQQETIPPIELGHALLEHRKRYDLTQNDLSSLIGLTPTMITQYERLVTALNPHAQSLIASGKLDARTGYEVSKLHEPNRQNEVAGALTHYDLGLHSSTKVVQLAQLTPSRPVESIIAQVQYNIDRDKANHRELLNEYKRKQVASTPPAHGTYRSIVIDPPWPIEKILRDERPNQFDIDYPTMSLDEIEALPVPTLAGEDGCHIYLWTTHKHLPDALNLFDSWDATYQCLITWVKNVGMTPFSWMYSTEHCLFGRIGHLQLLKMGKRLDFSAPVREHSRKPDEFYSLVREVSPEPRLDMFSREAHEGFEQWGNEVDKFATAKSGG